LPSVRARRNHLPVRFLPLVLLLAACSDDAEPRRGWRPTDHTQPPTSPGATGTEAAPAPADDDGQGRARAAAALFQMECASCHGANGLGASAGGIAAPSLASPTVVALTDEALITVIAQGRGAMPAFGARYTPDALRALVEHVRTLAPR